MSYPAFKNVAIVGLAKDEAPFIVSSADIEQSLKSSMERLKLPKGILAGLTGIQRRRLYSTKSLPSEIAAKTAEKILADFDRDKIKLLYSTSVCRDHVEPSTASIVQHRLNLGGAVKSLDIGSACLGFIDGMEMAAIQIEHGLIDYALIVAGENSAPIMESTIDRLSQPKADRSLFFRNFATLTLGSGGAAMLLGPASKHPDKPRLACSVSRSDASANHLCRGDADNMETDSTALMAAGVKLAKETFEKGIEAFGWTPQSFDSLICHQVSESNTKKFREALGIDEKILLKTFPDYGNMGPVAIPFTLKLAIEKQFITQGSIAALMGIGSGLCCSMMEIRF